MRVKRLDETMAFNCLELGGSNTAQGARELIVETPLLIAVGDTSIATLMCTPGDEMALTVGFLYTEGVIRCAGDVASMALHQGEEGNAVRVTPAAGSEMAARMARHRLVCSSGSTSAAGTLPAAAARMAPFTRPARRLTPQAIFALGALMNQRQQFFRRTGGTHAAILGRIVGGSLAPDATIIKEDIGRHSALDKVVGEALQRDVRLEHSLLMLSGRISFEMVSKAARAGISDLTAVSAPTALAVQLAKRLGMFLAGTARGESAVVYAGEEALMTP
jgi:FdhD protein